MLERISKIKEVGLFKGFEWRSKELRDFQKYNLFYGWGSSGKTTLSRIFALLEGEDRGSFIKWEKGAKVVFKTKEDKNITFTFERKKKPSFGPKVFVFNQDFVKENIGFCVVEGESFLVIGKARKKAIEEFLEICSLQDRLQTNLSKTKKTLAQKREQYKELEEFLEEYEKEKREAEHLKTFFSKIDRFAQRFREHIEKDVSFLEKGIETTQKELEKTSLQKEKILEKLKPDKNLEPILNTLLGPLLGRDDLHFRKSKYGFEVWRGPERADSLSENVLNTLGLIYFFYTVEKEREKGVIVVLDDPVAEFGYNYIHSVFGFIKDRIKALSPLQVFILTKNFLFFRLVRDWFSYEKRTNKEKVAFYQLKAFRNKEGRRESRIAPLDPLLQKYNSEYSFLFKIVYERTLKESSAEEDYFYPNIIRKLLENFLSFKVPTKASLHEKFRILCQEYSIPSQIRNALETYSQMRSHPLYQESFVKFDESLLGEISFACNSLIELIKRVDRNHFNHLLRECGYSKVVEGEVSREK